MRTSTLIVMFLILCLTEASLPAEINAGLMSKNQTVRKKKKILHLDMPVCMLILTVFRSGGLQIEPNPEPVFLCVLKSGFSLPHSLSSYPLMSSALPDASHYPQLSHNSLHQPQKSESSLVGSSAPWDIDSMVQPIIGIPGAPGFQSRNSHSGM